jgi:DNA-binding GntR family transcriptional regulator
MAARIFVIRADSMEINYLKMIYEEMQGMVDDYHPTYWNEKDLDFHTIIARGSRNNRVLYALSSVLEECLYISKIFSIYKEEEAHNRPPGHLRAVLDEHKRILDAISSGKEEVAEKVARESVHDGLERIMKAFVQFNRSKIKNIGKE